MSSFEPIEPYTYAETCTESPAALAMQISYILSQETGVELLGSSQEVYEYRAAIEEHGTETISCVEYWLRTGVDRVTVRRKGIPAIENRTSNL